MPTPCPPYTTANRDLLGTFLLYFILVLTIRTIGQISKHILILNYKTQLKILFELVPLPLAKQANNCTNDVLFESSYLYGHFGTNIVTNKGGEMFALDFFNAV